MGGSDGLALAFFGGNGKFGCSGEMSNYWGVAGEEARTTSNDSVDDMVVKGSTYILRLSFLIQV